MKGTLTGTLLLLAGLTAAQQHKPFYFTAIQLVTGQWVYARWVKAEAEGITVRFPDDTLSTLLLRPKEIRLIEVRRSNASTRYALWGAAAGFTIGFGAEWLESGGRHQRDINHIGRAAGSGLLLGFVGAAAGFAYGSVPKIYRVFGKVEQYNRLLPRLVKYNRM